jgi:hypothetical protein
MHCKMKLIKFSFNLRKHIMECTLCGRTRSRHYHESRHPEPLVCSSCLKKIRDSNSIPKVQVHIHDYRHPDERYSDKAHSDKEKRRPNVDIRAPVTKSSETSELPGDVLVHSSQLPSIPEEPPEVNYHTKPRRVHSESAQEI